jgi:hypothetical protein
MRTKHTPRAELLLREERTDSLLQGVMTVFKDIGDLLDLDPVDEVERFADANNDEMTHSR